MTVMSASSAARARMRSRCHARTPDTRQGAHHGIGAAAAKGRGARATGTVTGMRASLYSAEPQDYKSVTMLPAALLTQLRTAVGSDGVIDRPEALLVYECDGYTLERAAPEVVVLPRTPAEVAAVLRLLAAERIPFVPRGAGTGLSGGTLPVRSEEHTSELQSRFDLVC